MDNDLYEAVVEGNCSAIKNLRAKINQVTGIGGGTILHLASVFRKTECMRFILTEFANENFLIKVDEMKRTALHLAAERGQNDAVDLLINAARGLQGFENFIRKADGNNDTALHLAAKNNRLEVVKLLVKADPSDEHSQNLDSKTPLYLAADGGNKNIVKLICESCTTPTFGGPQGRTALHAAIENLDTDSVKLILEKKKDLIILADSRGWTAFHCAAYTNSDAVVNTLIEAHKSVVPQAVATEGATTALHIAASNGNISIIMQFMKFYGSSCDAVDENGRNILHIAASKSDREMIQCILQFCPANIDNILNKKDNDGNTPLHLLAIAGCFMPALIEHKGVDTTATNNNNLTPFDVLYSNEEIVADQLKIKKAFESIQGNQGWKNTWPGGSNATWESLVQSSKRMRKDAKFAIAKAEIMKKEVILYRERTNTQIIVTALITTVTFTVGFTMPGGYHQSGEVNEGLAVLSKKTAFDVFMVADAVALLLSTSSLFLYFISSMYQDPHQVSKLIAASTGLNIVSVIAMMLTFITGTYAVLPHSSALAIAVSVISCLFFPCIIFLLIKLIYDRNVKEKFKV